MLDPMQNNPSTLLFTCIYELTQIHQVGDRFGDLSIEVVVVKLQIGNASHVIKHVGDGAGEFVVVQMQYFDILE